jgi:hypothetical protein
MAKVSLELIDALRKTADKMEGNPNYQWGHMGACNCGFLAQQITRLSKAEIHHRAMTGYGDWHEQLNDYCSTSGLPMDKMISKLIDFGFDADDLKDLERLSGSKVLAALPVRRNLKHNLNADAVLYLRTWANLLEGELIRPIEINLVSVDELLLESK